MSAPRRARGPDIRLPPLLGAYYRCPSIRRRFKPIKSDELLRTIERALTRHQATLEAKRGFDVLQGRLATLTPREALVVQGKSNKQIAHELGAVERTIKAHRSKVMEKMKARTLLELLSIAERLGVSARDG